MEYSPEGVCNLHSICSPCPQLHLENHWIPPVLARHYNQHCFNQEIHFISKCKHNCSSCWSFRHGAKVIGLPEWWNSLMKIQFWLWIWKGVIWLCVFSACLPILTLYLILILSNSRCEDIEEMFSNCPLIIYPKSCTFCSYNPRVSGLKILIFKEKVLLVWA